MLRTHREDQIGKQDALEGYMKYYLEGSWDQRYSNHHGTLITLLNELLESIAGLFSCQYCFLTLSQSLDAFKMTVHSNCHNFTLLHKNA